MVKPELDGDKVTWTATTAGRKGPITGLVASHQLPLMQFVDGQWIIWLNYNSDRSAGTYLHLRPDGAIWRETLMPNGEVQSVCITPS